MSSKKEERKDETTVTSRVISPTEGNTDYRQSVNKALNETKDNVRRATDEARSQVPRYTQAVNDYQEQTIQASREIADNYLESQKEIINSLQSAWVPFAENAYGVFWNYWISPRRVTEVYAKVVSGLADNTIAEIRLANNMIFANMETFKATVEHARDNTKELSRIGVVCGKNI